jgi:diacylglycerol kinase (ATP)
MNNRVVLAVNPISGRGKGLQFAELYRQALGSAGYEVTELHSDQAQHVEQLQGARAIVVVGGDGTLRALLNSLILAQAPVYMVPAGTECLFARGFQMTLDPTDLIERLKSGISERHYVSRINGAPFYCMVSWGLDSKVVARLAQTRRRGISHLSYVLPTLIEFSLYREPMVTVICDGVEVVTKRKGYLILANAPHYARGVNPVPLANSSESVLHAKFFPRGGRGVFLQALQAAMLNQQLGRAGELMRGHRFEVLIDEAYPYQADGDNAGIGNAIVESSGEQIVVLT